MIKIDCPKLIKYSIILTISLLVFFPGKAFAVSSATINFQGKIVRNDTGYEGLNVTAGSPACVVAGDSNDTCDFQVKYYSASSAGTLLFTESFLNTEIGQYNGAFSLSLGGGSGPTAGTYAACKGGTCDNLEEVVNAVTDLYVELGFAPGGAGSYTETFSRMPIQASAYALKAKYASAANTAFQFDSAANSTGYSTPTAGMVYYDTTDAELKVYDGSSWGSVGGPAVASLWTDGGIFSYLTSLTDHFVLGASSYTAIGSDTYTTYLSGLNTRSPLSFDMTAERLTISGSQAQSGLTVYSDYASTGAWPVATVKAESTSFDNVVMQITQDGTGNILSLQKGSTEAFIFENPLTFYMHPRTDAPTTYTNRLYNVNGTLYWNGNAVLTGTGSLWTDGGTFTYLTSTTDDVVLGGSTAGTAKFFFDVSTGNLGIGTSTPGAKLDIAGTTSTITNITGDITITPAETVIVKANDTATDNLMEWQDSTGTVLGLVDSVGDATLGGTLTLGSVTGTNGSIKYNSTNQTFEFEVGTGNWIPVGDITKTTTLTAEYAGAVLSGDGTNNIGTMTSDNTGSSSNSMNYYEWSTSAMAWNDYDVRVRFALPTDFNGWGTGGVTLNFTTEDLNNSKMDLYIYKDTSATIDGSTTDNIPENEGEWTTTTVAGSTLNECANAGDVCVFVVRMYSQADCYVRIGDINITYNRSL